MPFVIGESVTVGAVFGDGRVNPKWFIWRGEKYPVDGITYTWRNQDGRDTIHHFAVLACGNLYELCYLERRMNWFLASVEMEGG